jgi:hypothetical protein
VDPEQQRGRGEDGTGVARRHERVGLARLLQSQTDGDAGIALAPHGGKRLLGHPDDFGGGADLDAAAVSVGMPCQLRLDDFRAPDELYQRFRVFGEGAKHALHLGPGGVIAPHRVHGDADHRYLSSTSTCFLPR